MLQPEDMDVLCCPKCGGDLSYSSTELVCRGCASRYPVTDGIPRLLHFGAEGAAYNAMWDYKWVELDGGRGYNFEMLEEGSEGYLVHNVFRYFVEDGEALAGLGDASICIDIGCGTGQYTVSLLRAGAKRVYAVDLTRGVDVGRSIIARKFPELLDRIVFVQANARFLPIKTGVADRTMALASIHHSGYLPECVEQVVRVTKPGKRFFVWIYAKPQIPMGDEYRANFLQFLALSARLLHYIYMELLFNILKRLPDRARLPVLRAMASDAVYRLRALPVLGRIVSFFTPGVTAHSDKGYRLINLYDAYAPGFSQASDEADVIRWSRRLGFRIVSFIPWRLGFVGEKPGA